MSPRISLLILSAIALAGCDSPTPLPPRTMSASAERGLAAIRAAECGACHVIPGIRAAHGRLGPSLVRYQTRIYIAGRLPNNQADLARWIMAPPAVKPGTAMPAPDVDYTTALDMAAYLLEL